MSEAIICPVCDTYNPHDATHCEVCGERLTPVQPGEEVAPEESVASMIADEAPVEGLEETPVPEAAEGEGPDEAELEQEFAELEAAEGGGEFEDEALEEGTAADDDEFEPGSDEYDDEGTDDGAFGDEGFDEGEFAAGDGEPEFLYSPVDGAAYPKGSEEYEDGFGPMGEELVAEPPEELAPVDTPDPEGMAEQTDGEAGFGNEYDEGGFDADEYDEPGAEEAFEEEGRNRPSAQFEAVFQKRERERPAMEPLPSPGTLAEPATLTLYVNREPVHTHPIDTDEILIGRRDPVADAYPDLDLTDYDPKSEVSRKHAYVYRQNKNHTLYVVSNAGTQINSDLLELGDRRPLTDGDVIVLSGKFAIKFEVPEQS